VMAGHSEEETQAAVDFAFFLLESENMKAWHKASGYFPVTQTAIAELEAEGWFEENPIYEIALLQVMPVEPNAANAGTRSGAYTLVRDALTDAIQSFVTGDSSPEEALAAAKERADAAIEEYNSFFSE
jgi:sn-glycerol 3-phosphate transport system substrate-binding protein